MDVETEYVHDEPEFEVRTKYTDIKDGKIWLNEGALRCDYEGGKLTFTDYFKKSEWKSLQFHFHAPAEHTINGKTFDAEMHMVFKGETYEKELAVVGLLYEVSEDAQDDPFLESLRLKELTKPKSENNGINVSLTDLYNSLPSYENFHYQGSLTTPDYDEIVQWFLFTEPVKIPASQLKIMADFWKGDKHEGCVKGNARHLQKLGSRIIHKIKHVHEG